MRNIGTFHHVSCACKMSPTSDPMAVVSQYGRVHGVDNVWVADTSIMPDCIRANTTATAIMIRERVAEFMTSGTQAPFQDSAKIGVCRKESR
ncbi:Oxygen-dependent choline dehydrogenase [Candidatus Entotheonellaceae bacterium PAL068K]